MSSLVEQAKAVSLAKNTKRVIVDIEELDLALAILNNDVTVKQARTILKRGPSSTGFWVWRILRAASRQNLITVTKNKARK
jgi:hypothetical protein